MAKRKRSNKTKQAVKNIQNKLQPSPFASLGIDVICKIYEYCCCSLPLDTMINCGMDSFAKRLRKTINGTQTMVEFKTGFVNPLQFSLICREFAKAMNHRPRAVVIRKASWMPSATYLSNIEKLPLLCAVPNWNISKKLVSVQSASGLYFPVHLKLECKQGTDSVALILSKYKPQILTLSHLQIVPKLTALPSTVHTVSITCGKRKSAVLSIGENLLHMLETSPSVHTVTIVALLVTNHFLDGLLKVDHVKHIVCVTNTAEFSAWERHVLVDKYRALGKSLSLRVSRFAKNYKEYDVDADYTDAAFEKQMQDLKQARAMNRKYHHNQDASESSTNEDENEQPAKKRQRI